MTIRNVFLGLMAILAACSSEETSTTPVEASSKQASIDAPLFYHIFVRSFADSDGDQHGDLRGIIEKMDYLQSLGVTGILLTPLYPSAFYHNYFADDFYGIDQEFGSLTDYQEMIAAAHARDMVVYLDQEIQYVSGQHQWYRDALNNPSSPFNDFVLFSDEGNSQPIGTLFDLTEFRVWPAQEQEILTVDLLSPSVYDYFTDYMLFWMDPNGDGNFSDGVDGFRIDHMMDDLDNAGVLPGLFENFWSPMFDRLRSVNPAVQIIAEQADWGYGEAFLSEGNADMVFAFPIRGAVNDLSAGDFAVAVSKMSIVIGEGKNQFVFVENHDTDRFASLHESDERILQLGAAANLLTGWIPIIHYGQELGMRGEKLEGELPEMLLPSEHDVRDIPVREAMRWVADESEGPRAHWYHLFPEAYNQPSANDNVMPVDVQTADDRSLLNFYRRLSSLRASHPALADGSTKVVELQGDVVLIKRQAGKATTYVAFNFSPDKQVATDVPGEALTAVAGSSSLEAGTLVLSGYGVALLE
ncbi:MAG: DUF3459 domain-containing protein [Parvularculaceae bacterium]|nr:DUF3459 domain-containing protein [Parvularculaceae bacterium]